MPQFSACLQTRRLLLRCWDISDAPQVQDVIAANLDHLRPWLDWAHHEPVSLEEKRKWLQARRGDFEAGRDFNFGIFDRHDQTLLGAIGAHRRIGAGAIEIGYWLRQDRTGQGLVSEAAAAVVCEAFRNADIARIEIHCDPTNLASNAIPRKLGFALLVTIPRCVRNRTLGPRDTAIWALDRTGYERAGPARSI